MPTDLASIADPAFILLAWAGGLSLAGGVVGLARIVGPGFMWLVAGSAGFIGLAGAFGSGAWWARFALFATVIALIWARNGAFAGLMMVAAGLGFVIQAALVGGWLPAATAALGLGGVTGEMMLGHWYLVDPRLPRSALRGLAIAGIVGLVADAVVLVFVGGMPPGGATVAFWVLLATSIVLMAGVIGALRYPAYSGVMAATGLSYLAVLTTLGAVFLGRALVAGLGPFVT